MENIALNRIEKKCLYAIKRYPHADIGIWELNGYLHFPALENILGAIGRLEAAGMIEGKESPFHGFQILGPGEEYVRKHKLAYTVISHAQAILLSAIAGVAAGVVLYLLGFS